MKVITPSVCDQDGNPGICFGAVYTEAETDKITVNMIFDDILIERSDDPNMPNQDLPAVDDFQRGPNEDALRQYKRGGYTYLQNIIANEILINTRGTEAYISMLYTGMKTNEYVKGDFSDQIRNVREFIIIFVVLAPMYAFIYNCTEEKG